MEKIETALYSRALVNSLSDAPLLVDDLPEASCWGVPLSAEGDCSDLNFDQKLGHLYEDAMAALIRTSAQFDLLAKNLQVFDEAGRTIGELDFLIRDLATDEVFQLEIAVKFYLAVWDEQGRESYPGPDPRDNWINKLEHMRSRQLRLCERPETQRLLHERFGVGEVRVRQRVYGVMFDRLSSSRVSSPPFVRASCRRAKWLYAKEWAAFYGDASAVRIVPKCLWPVRLNSELLAKLEVVSVEELKCQASDRCVMFWDEAREDVVFLVPNEWPDLSSFYC